MDITSPLIRDYIASVMPERSEALEALRNKALANDVPIIQHEVEQFLTFLVTLHQPKRILEIGTAVGYSSIIMMQASDEKTTITTLEIAERMWSQALKNFEAFGFADRIHLIQGDAVQTIKSLKGPYDMIFMDAAKGQYLNFYEDSLRMLKPGGVLIADNILQDGLIAKSRYAIPRRQRTIHGRMRDFIKGLSDHPDLTTSVLPIADGITLSYRKR